MIKYKDLNMDYLINMFPEFEEEIRSEVDWLGEFLPHCVFRMYEDFAVNGDEETQNLLQVTLLEYLWDEKITYERSLEMMGAGTKVIWDYIHAYIFMPSK